MTTANQILTLDFETILLSVRESAHKANETISRDEAYQRASVEQHRRRQTLIQAAIGVQRRLAAQQQGTPVVRASSTTSTTPIGSQPGDLPSTLRREVDALTEDGMDRSEAVASVRDDVAAFLDDLEDEGEEDDDAPRKRTAKAKAPKATAKPKAKTSKAANDEDEDDEDEDDEAKPAPKAEMRDVGDVAREIQARDPSIGWESAVSEAFSMQLTGKASQLLHSAPATGTRHEMHDGAISRAAMQLTGVPRTIPIPTRREVRARKGVSR